MLEGILSLIAFICGLIPTSVWIAFILLSGIACVVSGESLGLLLRTVVVVFIAYWLLKFIAWLLPDWLENILLVGVVIGLLLRK